MGERFEASALGRVLISAFVIATLLALVVWNMPDSELRREGLHAARPYVNALGLDQNWGVFAPNPRRQTIALEATLTYATGTTRTWHLPSGGDLVGAYWDYHWLKWAEWTVDGRYPELAEATAEFIVRRDVAAGRHPVRIELVRRWRDLPPPGTEQRSPWQEKTILDRVVQNAGGAP